MWLGLYFDRFLFMINFSASFSVLHPVDCGKQIFLKFSYFHVKLAKRATFLNYRKQLGYQSITMKINVAYPATGCQKLFEINDEIKVRNHCV